MKLSFVTLGCPDWNLEKIAQKASEFGYDGVELRVKGDKHVDAALSAGERKRVRDLFTQRGLDISCLAGYSTFNSIKEEELEQNRRLLLDNVILARDLGAPFVRTFVGQTPEGIPEEEIIKKAAQYIGSCGDLASKEGIGIVIETHDDYCHGEKLKKVLDLMESRAVNVLWDIENNHRQKETPGNFFRVLGGRIKHLHVRDSYLGEDGEYHICLTGRGSVPFGECISLLNTSGYNGYLSFEWEKLWHPELEEPETAFPQFIEYMKGL